ncbi:MAG: DinB family protein [Anaerolineae bacterium]
MIKDLVQRLERNRDEFMKTAAQLTDDVAGLSLGEDDWTIWGVMAHLTAAEWQLRRMAEIIARKPTFAFESFDRDEMNARSVARYESKPLSEIVEQWQSNRQKMIEFAGSLAPEQLQNVVLHPVYGEIDPVYPIERQIWHITAHLAEIRGALRPTNEFAA